jgi:glycosyltransferase involved in cell wall biosynthesis
LPFIYEVRGFLEESWLSRHDGQDARASDRFVLARCLETRCMREADAVVTLSEQMKAEIAARGIPAERIYVLPNAVDESLLDQVPDASGVRYALGATDGEIVLGTISTFYPHEGIDILVRATATLRDRGAKVRLALVGDGTERQALEHLVGELGIHNITTMTGRVPFEHVRSYYAALDIFVAPRTDDRVSHMVTPLKPIEAMAAGCAVVGSAVGGLVEIIEDGVTGVLVPPGDPSVLADALEPLLYDEALRSRLAKTARERIASDLTWSRNAERYRSLYASLGAA